MMRQKLMKNFLNRQTEHLRQISI